MQALQKALDWLAEQPEDAAELAALLSEAAPKLGFNAQKSKMPGISRAATSRKSLELLHADMSLMQRLQAARPMLVGASPLLSASSLSKCETLFYQLSVLMERVGHSCTDSSSEACWQDGIWIWSSSSAYEKWCLAATYKDTLQTAACSRTNFIWT